MKSNSNTAATGSGISMQDLPMNPLRKTALVAGLLYLLTFVSIPTLALYSSIHGPAYVTGTGPDTAAIVGGILEIIVALAGIGTAIALYPLLRQQSEGLALGLVVSRVLEAGTMFVGVAFILSIVSLRQEGAGTGALATGHALITLYDRIFLLGQSFMPAINDLLLGFLLYQTRLVPRALSLIGMIGAVPLIASYIAVLFGVIGQHDPLTGWAALLVALFEFSLGIYLVVKGFRPSGITSDNKRI